MDNDCQLNLRKFSRDLRAQLKADADRLGMDLTEYCTAIFEQRARLTIKSARPDVEEADPGNVTPSGPGMPGWWGAPAATTGSTTPVVAIDAAPAAKRQACAHGYINQALCPSCRASA